eukprot:s1304_g14.t1
MAGFPKYGVRPGFVPGGCGHSPNGLAPNFCAGCGGCGGCGACGCGCCSGFGGCGGCGSCGGCGAGGCSGCGACGGCGCCGGSCSSCAGGCACGSVGGYGLPQGQSCGSCCGCNGNAQMPPPPAFGNFGLPCVGLAPPPAPAPPAPKPPAPVAPLAPAVGCCGSPTAFMQQMEMLQKMLLASYRMTADKMLRETQERNSHKEPLDVMQQLAQQAQLQHQQEKVPSQRKEEPLPTPMVKAQAPDPPNLEPPPPAEAPPPVSQARSRSRDGAAGRKKSSSSSSSPSRKRSPSRRRRSRRRSRSRRDSRRRSPSRRRDSRARRSRSGRKFSRRSRSRRSRSNRYRRPERPRSPPRGGDRAPRFNDMTPARREECGDFKRGKCTRGDRCRFAHVNGGGSAGGGSGAAARPELRGAENGERPGDWKCPNCAVMVFASKNECFKCHTRKDGTKGTGMEGSGPPPEKYSEALWEKPRQQIGLKLVGELSNSAWQYVLSDESRRCFAAYLSCPFSHEQTKQYFNVIKDGTDWKQPEGPNGPIPRKTAWMVASNGCQCTYRYGRSRVFQ